ncbi:hypothetical protein PSI9734_00793 [Pseudidiomarina piscicola]|uniref:Peptidase M1 membrane alanine aminopeptidase domain-containing protein n=1 Tax=Pseudidiomarina piscicola TaxID=2614830 RepID=A0A6S6WIN7_9GAMM|nr:hypothetical protein [Pseudidiomarina piscicola]CAB0150236.1 hypothetical protein PSI9734_00793 [Pseudidiomarina piscicola]VZT39667.1 hypothetical protein PSI9734_00793 [Pseudomonas aeruginosa]
MHKKLVLGTLLVCAIVIWLAAAWLDANSHARIQVNVTKSAEKEWFVVYQFDEQVARVTFVRNPDHTRLQRWQPVESEFYLAIDSETGHEYIARVDGQTFTTVAFKLDASYVALRKDYAPFTPFSDGGTAWFTGRFKVCPEHCASALKFSYQFTMQAPLADFIRLPEQSQRGQLTWQESASDGQMVYVGPQQLMAASDTKFETIIDPILPDSLKRSLTRDVPPLTNYFNQRMPHLTERPMLLASFSATRNGQFGYQGGVVANQMVLHWYGHSLAERANAPYFVEDTLWFVAHEFAHLYQASQFSNEDAWLHEGAAEFMALSYLRSIRTNGVYLDRRVATARETCVSTEQRYQVHYACGLLWAAEIDQYIKKTYPHGLFFLWFMYVEQLTDAPRTNATPLYFELLSELTDDAFAAQLRERIQTRYQRLPTL